MEKNNAHRAGGGPPAARAAEKKVDRPRHLHPPSSLQRRVQSLHTLTHNSLPSPDSNILERTPRHPARETSRAADTRARHLPLDAI